MNTKNTLIAIVALFATSASFAQVGIGTTSPDESASLELQSTTKGFLPPRLTTTERGDIISPAVGLTIYNKEVNCLQWYNGTGWFDACSGSTFVAPSLGSGFTNGFQNNNTCTTKVISVTSCASVAGATLNDDTGTTDGTEYDWTDATSYMGGTTTRALVEIGGQCWFGRNSNTPSPYTGTNDFDGYYSNAASEPAVGEGRLYQWDAAMNGVSGPAAERAQGVCPTGWHVPSDCEWMYLENTLGMSTTNQQLNTYWRNSGNVGGKLSTLTRETPSSANGSGTNSSGFTALLAGVRNAGGSFSYRGDHDRWWSSSETSTTFAQRRGLNNSQAGVYRSSLNNAFGFSVRCLKD